MGVLSLIKWIDRFGAQQRLLHPIHLPAVRRVDYMRRCILLGMEKKGNLALLVGAIGACLLVREEEELVNLVLWLFVCLFVCFEFNFHPLRLLFVDFRHSREYIN